MVDQPLPNRGRPWRLANSGTGMDCHIRQLLGWHLSHSDKPKTAEAALQQALNCHYGSLGRVRVPFLLRSDDGLIFTSRRDIALRATTV